MTEQKRKVMLPLLLSLMMVAGMYIGYELRDKTGGGNKFFSTSGKSSVQEVMDLVKSRYVDQVQVDSISQLAIDQILSHLDPHSIYIPPAELTDVNDELMGSFQGVGIEFQMLQDTLHVTNVVKGGPSDKAGIQSGDKLLTVNDTIALSGRHIAADEIRNKLRGEAGTTVDFLVLRNSKRLKFKVTRGKIPVPTIESAYEIAKGIGYIRIDRFGERTYEEFMQHLEALQKKGVTQLIIDLRENGGGLLAEATAIADEFLSEDKLVVYTEGVRSNKYEYRCKREGLFEKGNLVVLVDEASASASEVLAGALQDWDRATIIGRRTFGKGLVQQQFALSNGGAVRLTTARYFTPLGRNIQKPYANQPREQYDDEYLNRYKYHASVSADTVGLGPVFKTPKGKKVYGGGGITPDFQIAFDTLFQAPILLELYDKRVFGRFVYQFYSAHKTQFSGITHVAQIATVFDAQKEWGRFQQFAQLDSINLTRVNPSVQQYIQQHLQAMMARQLFEMDGYLQVLNSNDKLIDKALSVLQK